MAVQIILHHNNPVQEDDNDQDYGIGHNEQMDCLYKEQEVLQEQEDIEMKGDKQLHPYKAADNNYCNYSPSFLLDTYMMENKENKEDKDNVVV